MWPIIIKICIFSYIGIYILKYWENTSIFHSLCYFYHLSSLYLNRRFAKLLKINLSRHCIIAAHKQNIYWLHPQLCDERSASEWTRAAVRCDSMLEARGAGIVLLPRKRQQLVCSRRKVQRRSSNWHSNGYQTKINLRATSCDSWQARSSSTGNGERYNQIPRQSYEGSIRNFLWRVNHYEFVRR